MRGRAVSTPAGGRALALLTAAAGGMLGGASICACTTVQMSWLEAGEF